MDNNIFIGRNKELEILQSAYNDAKNGLGKLFLVNGGPGLGKSGLVRQFLRNAEEAGDCITAISECNDKEGVNAYAPFKELLLKLNAVAVSNSSEKKKKNFDKLKSFITDAGTQWVGMIPVVGSFAQAGIETYKAYHDNYGKKGQENVAGEDDIYRIFENEFRRLAQNKTVVIFLDDLQWADSSSLNLLFALGKSVRENPFQIFVIGTYRPHDIETGRNKISESGQNITIRHPLADKLNELRNYTKHEQHITRTDQWLHEISLQPLSKDEVSQLINTKFTNNNFPESFHLQINELSNGQPLYVIEILDYLVKNGNIKSTADDSYTIENAQLNELPVSVQAIINEKVERLNDDLKKVLSYASVSGEEFAVQVVEKLLKIDELDLLDYLEELSKKHGLLIANEPIYVKNMLFELYKFSQTLVHKHIYENLDGARRRALHRRIAETLKNIYGDELGKNKEVKDKYVLHTQIGQGLIDGVTLQLSEIKGSDDESNVAKDESVLSAAKSELKSAEENFEQYAVNECLTTIDKALGLLSKVSAKSKDSEIIRFEAFSLRNRAKEWEGFYQEALAAAEEMLKVADYLKDTKLKAIGELAKGSALHWLGNYNAAIELLSKALDAFKLKSNFKMAANCVNAMALSKEMQSFHKDAIELLNQSLEFCENLDDDLLAGKTLYQLANNQRKLGALDISENIYKDALEIFEKAEDQKQIGLIYNSLGLNSNAKGEYYKALEFLEKALEISQRQNDIINTGNRLNNLGLIYMGICEFDKALDFYNQTLEIDSRLNDKPKMAISYGNVASAYRSIRKYDKAEENFKKSLEIYQSIDDIAGTSYAWSTLGLNYYEKGESEKAKECFNKSIEIDKSIDDQLSLGSNYLMIGNLFYDEEKYEEAKGYYVKSHEIYKNTEDQFSIANITNNIAGIEYALGNYNEALEFYEQTMAYYQKTDDKAAMSMLLGNIANNYEKLGEYEKAVDTHKRAISYDKEINDRHTLAKHLRSYGIALYNKGDYQESIEILEESSEVYAALGDYENLTTNVTDIADAYKELGMPEKASEYYNNAGEIFLKHGDKNSAAAAWRAMANFQKGIGEEESAVENYYKSLELYVELDHFEAQIDTYLEIGLYYRQKEDYAQAGDHVLKALEIAEKIESSPYMAKCCKEMCWVYYYIDNYENAIEICNKALELHNDFDDKWERADCHYVMAETLFLHPEKGLDFDAIAVHLDESIKLFSALEDWHSVAYSLQSKGALNLNQQNYSKALQLFEKARAYLVEIVAGFDTSYIDGQIAEAKANMHGDARAPGAV